MSMTERRRRAVHRPCRPGALRRQGGACRAPAPPERIAGKVNGALVSRPCAGGIPGAGFHCNGFWRIVHPDGSVEEGHCFAGRMHGTWVLRDATGAAVAHETWRHGWMADRAKAGGE